MTAVLAVIVAAQFVGLLWQRHDIRRYRRMMDRVYASGGTIRAGYTRRQRDAVNAMVDSLRAANMD